METGQQLIRYALIQNDTGAKEMVRVDSASCALDGWSMPLILNAVNQVYHGGEVDRTPQFNTFIKYITEQDERNCRLLAEDPSRLRRLAIPQLFRR